jgi:type 1 fimbria pilin
MRYMLNQAGKLNLSAGKKMKSKIKLTLASVVSSYILAGSAFAGGSETLSLQLKGTLKPAACTVALSKTEVDLGTITQARIRTEGSGGKIEFIDPVDLTVECDASALSAFEVSTSSNTMIDFSGDVLAVLAEDSRGDVVATGSIKLNSVMVDAVDKPIQIYDGVSFFGSPPSTPIKINGTEQYSANTPGLLTTYDLSLVNNVTEADFTDLDAIEIDTTYAFTVVYI